MESKVGGQGVQRRVKEHLQDGIFRRKHKDPGTKSGEELYTVRPWESHSPFGCLSFLLRTTMGSFSPSHAVMELKRIKSDNAPECLLKPGVPSKARSAVQTLIVIKRSRCRKEGRKGGDRGGARKRSLWAQGGEALLG